jgi:acetolactate synthase small subunit
VERRAIWGGVDMIYTNKKEVQDIVNRMNKTKKARKTKKFLRQLMKLLPRHKVILLGDTVLMEPEFFRELMRIKGEVDGTAL